ncbi:Transposable element Tc1 transposase [Anthophora quadrimaculata]
MGTKKIELSVEMRSQIITLSKEGYSIRSIAEKVGVSKSCVSYSIKKYGATGICSSVKRTGRPRKTTQAEDRHIITISKRNRRDTATEIAAEVNKSREETISVSTIKRRLKEGGLRGCVAVKKPLLRKQNKKKRLQWAKCHKNWTLEDWKKVLWSDESKFEVFGSKRRVFVRRKVAEILNDNCVVPTVKHGGRSVMVWGCFGNNMTGDLIKINGILRKEGYLNILRENAIPSGHRVIGNNFTFMHDNDPKHTSAICRNYLLQLQENSQVKIMESPPQSPDLNPIEKLWDQIDRQVRKRCPKSEKHLWEILESEWNLTDTEIMKKLIARMPRLVNAVIKARGGYVDENKI